MAGRRDLSDVSFLLTLGLLLNDSTGYKGKLITFIHGFVVGIQNLGTVLSDVALYFTESEQLMRSAAICCGSTMVMIHAIHLWLLRPVTVETIKTIRTLLLRRNEQRHRDYFDKVSTEGWMAMKPYLFGVFAFNVSCIILPVLYDLYLTIFTDSTEPFVVVFPFGSLLGDQEITRSFSYYVLQAINYTWLLSLSLICIGFYTYLFLLALFTSCETRAIAEDIIDWGANYKNDSNSIENLKKIIRDHQEFLRVADILRVTFGLPILMYYLLWAPCFTFSVYSAVINWERDFLGGLPSFILALTMTPAFLFACIVGQRIETESLRVFDSICDIEWPEMTTKTKKDLLFLMTRSMKPFTIHYRGYGHLNLTSFTEVMNTCYSLLTLAFSLRQ